MQAVIHMCGRRLWRVSSLFPHPTSYVDTDHQGVDACPSCGEALCDTDLTDATGIPLVVKTPTDWSRNRRAARGWVEGQPVVFEG